MVFDVNAGVDEREQIIDPSDRLRRKILAGKRYETLLRPLALKGKACLTAEDRDAMTAQQRVRQGLDTLDESQKRLTNPHSYPVGLERSLFKRREALVDELRGQ